MNIRLGILTASLLLASSMASGQAPPPNPVFVNDSAEAARLLAMAEGITETNPAESIRLIQVVLDEHGQTLVPDPGEPGRFESTRDAALAILRANPDLLEVYTRAESSEARRLLEQGRLRRLIETRPLTAPGLEALLLLGQQGLETGRFSVASTWLQEALDHPAMEDEDRWAAWLMLAMVAHARDDLVTRGLLANQLSDGGPEAQPWFDALETWSEDPAPLPWQGHDTLDATNTAAGPLLSPALWQAPYQRTPASIMRSNELAEDVLKTALESGRMTAIFPAVQGEYIIVNEGAELVCMDLFTGIERWRTSVLPPADRSDRVGDPIGPTAVAVDEEDVIAWIGYSLDGGTSETEQVVCLDAGTGEIRWRFDLANTPRIDEPYALYPAGPPVIHDDRVFVIARRESRQGLKSCYLLAIDRSDGTPLSTTYIASTGSQYRDGSLRPLTMPVVEGDQIFVATSIGAIGSINVASGRLEWVQRMDTPVSGTRPLQTVRPYDIHVPVVIGDNLLSISPDFRHIVRLDRFTGKREQVLQTEGRVEWNNARYLLADDERLYVVGSSISAFDPENLAVPIWTSSPRVRGEGQGMPPAGRVHLAGDRLYAPTGSSIAEIDTATGTITRRLPIPDSALPLVVQGHLLVGGTEGLSLHSDGDSIAVTLKERLEDNPDHPGTHLALIRIAARSDNLDELLDRATTAIDLIMDAEDTTERDREVVRQVIFDEVHSTLDPEETVDPQDYRRVAGLLDRLTRDTDMAAASRLALGDWIAKSDPAEAVSNWLVVESDPRFNQVMREEETVLAPSAHWARLRLSEMAKVNPDLVTPLPWRDTSPSDPWSRRVHALAFNLREQRDRDKLGQLTVQMLEDSLIQDRATDGLAMLDLWQTTHGNSQPLPGPDTTTQWRAKLVAAARPVIPRSDQLGGQSRRWDGRLVHPLDTNHLDPSQPSFFRSYEDRLSLHEGPEYDVSWSATLPHRDAAIVRQDEQTATVLLQQLGRPPHLVSLAMTDGDVLWDLELPGDLFPPQRGMDDANIVAFAPMAHVAIIPVGSRIILMHPDGRTIAIDADAEPVPQWTTDIPGYVFQFHAPWHDGVAAIGYRVAANDSVPSWVESVPESGDMILAWIDAEQGNITTMDIPVELGGAQWMKSNQLGDLIIGGTHGVALVRSPEDGLAWISRGWPLQAHRIREEARITPRSMIVTDLKNTMHTFSLETGLRRTPEPSPGRDTPSSLPQITVSGDRLWLRYESELLILDADGQLVGSDATSRTQGHTLEALAPFSDGLVLVSHVRNQPSFRTSAGLRGSGHQHRLHVLSPGGRTEDLVDLYQLDSKIRAARAVHDALLLSTDDEILTVTLPPALAPGQPGP